MEVTCSIVRFLPIHVIESVQEQIYSRDVDLKPAVFLIAEESFFALPTLGRAYIH